MQKVLLEALLRPWERFRAAEDAQDTTALFVVTEQIKDLPAGAVWDEFCARNDVPTGQALIGQLEGYSATTNEREP